MLKSKRLKTVKSLVTVRQDNIDNWTDEDRAFYEDFLNDIPNIPDTNSDGDSSQKTDDSWENFKKRNNNLLAGSG